MSETFLAVAEVADVLKLKQQTVRKSLARTKPFVLTAS
jgi:hypothetical protein